MVGTADKEQPDIDELVSFDALVYLTPMNSWHWARETADRLIVSLGWRAGYHVSKKDFSASPIALGFRLFG
jgi:hypothetical protein